MDTDTDNTIMATETATNDGHEDSSSTATDGPFLSQRAAEATFSIIIYQVVGAILLFVTIDMGILFIVVALFTGLSVTFMSVRAILREVTKLMDEHTVVREQD